MPACDFNGVVVAELGSEVAAALATVAPTGCGDAMLDGPRAWSPKAAEREEKEPKLKPAAGAGEFALERGATNPPPAMVQLSRSSDGPTLELASAPVKTGVRMDPPGTAEGVLPVLGVENESSGERGGWKRPSVEGLRPE